MSSASLPLRCVEYIVVDEIVNGKFHNLINYFQVNFPLDNYGQYLALSRPMNMNAVQNELITTTEAARLHQVRRQTIGQWIRKGWLSANRIGQNYLVNRAEVLAFDPPRGAYRVSRDTDGDGLPASSSQPNGGEPSASTLPCTG